MRKKRQKSWANFKTHFTAAQINYKKARPSDTTSIHQYTSNRANIVKEALQQLDAQPMYDMNNDTLANIHTAAAVTQQPKLDISSLIAAVKDLQNSLNISTVTNTRTPNDTTTTKLNRRPRNPYKNQQYCWSHVACNHTSKACTQRATGHKEEATFTNMLGGSTKRCFRLRSTWRCGMVSNKVNKSYLHALISPPPQPHAIAAEKKLVIKSIDVYISMLCTSHYVIIDVSRDSCGTPLCSF